MARRKKKDTDWLGLVGPLAGFLMMVSFVSPQFRAIIFALPMLLAIGVGTGLVVYVVWMAIRAKSARCTFPRSPSSQQLPQPEWTPTPAEITPGLLADLEWRSFEILVTQYFQKKGFEARRKRAGADGGVDILVSRPGQAAPHAYVQCKAWRVYNVRVKPVRELFGVMAADHVPEGYFVTSGEFSAEATEFARGKPLILLNGAHLIGDFNRLPEESRRQILHEVTSGDFTTPTCPRSDEKMVERQGPTSAFWGCSHYPRCRQTFGMRH